MIFSPSAIVFDDGAKSETDASLPFQDTSLTSSPAVIWVLSARKSEMTGEFSFPLFFRYTVYSAIGYSRYSSETTVTVTPPLFSKTVRYLTEVSVSESFSVFELYSATVSENFLPDTVKSKAGSAAVRMCFSEIPPFTIEDNTDGRRFKLGFLYLHVIRGECEFSVHKIVPVLCGFFD
ncbi:unknown [Candidatus Colimorpha enterica]|uniref:Uncharacterized protein n=1 Tax=Candidatus Colimorpha enterica TaxID=3083063 RepID=R6TW37_9BACT|nr:unknown [Candidatus Colimorpha enterica]